MKQEKDITGRRFGRLTAIRNDGIDGPNLRIKWLCRCDCGAEISIYKEYLMDGRTRSCGCLRRERMIKMNEKRYGKR